MTRPSPSTVMTGTFEDDPNVPTFELTVASDTAPEDTSKSSELNDATPLALEVASATEIATLLSVIVVPIAPVPEKLSV